MLSPALPTPAKPIPSMPKTGAQFQVAVYKGVLCARVVGLGTQANCATFHQYLAACCDEGYRKLILDLSSCTGFDSTFMGVLIGVVQEGGKVVLLNATAEHRRLLAEVGVDCMVQIKEGETQLPEVPLQTLDQKPIQKKTRLRTILKAHENLVHHDPANADRFAAFLDLFRKELGELG